jgi:hypothetical protein
MAACLNFMKSLLTGFLYPVMITMGSVFKGLYKVSY